MKRTMSVVLFGCLLWAPRVGERDRTESGAIAVVRAIVSGELAYASRNEGYFDTLPCLESGSCSPGQRPHVPSLAPDLVERHFTSAQQRRDYRLASSALRSCPRKSTIGNLTGTGAQGRLIRRKTSHPAFQARTPSHLPSSRACWSGTWPIERRNPWRVSFPI